MDSSRTEPNQLADWNFDPLSVCGAVEFLCSGRSLDRYDRAYADELLDAYLVVEDVDALMPNTFWSAAVLPPL